MDKNSKKNISIVDYLYSYSTLPELLQQYASDLHESNITENMLHANKLKEYYNVLTDDQFLSNTRSLIDSLYSFAKDRYPKLLFYLEGRRKAVISSDQKMLLYLKQNKSLDDFRDILAFRFTLFIDNSLESLMILYSLMDDIIKFMISKGYTPCEATPTFQTEGFNPENFPDIVIPPKTYLSSDNIHLVKDYIIHPKVTGYQSLHVAFRDYLGRCIEIQSRTISMHIHAESHSTAGHDFYKNSKYSGTEIEFDRTKVHINGYAVSDGTLFDYIGLEKPFQIIQKGRTF